MNPSEIPALRRYWYPLSPLADLAAGPRAFRLLGVDLVLWLDAAGDPAAAADRCCHRTMKLSKGFVEGGNVVCGYHGWTFDRTGRCVRVPQRAAGAPAPKFGIPAYRARAKYGHVWVALEEPVADIPDFAEDADPAWRRIPEFAEDWACGALRLMENEFDNAHIEFVHKKTFGATEDPAPARNDIDEFADGFVTHTVIKAANRGIGAAYNGVAPGTLTTRTTVHRFWLPFLRKLDLEYPNGTRHRIVTSATPVDDTHTRLVQWAYRDDTEADVPAARAIAFDRAVTLEDKAVLETTDPFVPFATGSEIHMPSDRPGILMRRLLAGLSAAA